MAEETVLLNFEIDNAEAEKNLIAVNKAILDNKKSIDELKKAYKDGSITQEEFVKESLRVQQNLTKERKLSADLTKSLDIQANSIESLSNRNSELIKQRNKLDLTSEAGIKKVARINSEIDKNNAQIQKNVSLLEQQKINIGNYTSALSLVSPQLGSIISSFSGLGGAAIQTSNAIQATGLSLKTLNSIPIVALVSGAISVFQLLNKTVGDTKTKLDEATAAQDKFIRKQQQDRDLFLKRINELEAFENIINRIIREDDEERAKGLNKAIDAADILANRLQRLAEINKESGENEKLTFQERIDFLNKSIKQFEEEERVRKKAINDFIESNKLYVDGKVFDNLLSEEQTLKLQDQLNEIGDTARRNIKSVQQEIEKVNDTIAAFEKSARDFIKISDIDLLAEADSDEQIAKLKEFDKERLGDQSVSPTDIAKKEEIEFNKVLKALFGERAELYAFDYAEYLKNQKKKEDAANAQIEAERRLYAASASIFGSLSQLAEEGSNEQKALALVSIAADTAAALTGGIAASQDIPYPGNLAAMASTIAAILSAVAQAKQIFSEGYAEGGFTGSGGKYQPAGIVHKGEYVAPQHVMKNPAAQPHISALESMRLKGYADGGFVMNQSTASANNSLLVANAFKNMPVPVVSVQEITRTQTRIRVKEQTATL